MTETLVVVEPPSQESGQRPPSAAELDAARELVRLARQRGVALTGPDGLLKAVTKGVIETALDEEMSEHPGYDRHDPAGRNRGNSRTAHAPRQCCRTRPDRCKSTYPAIGTARSNRSW